MKRKRGKSRVSSLRLKSVPPPSTRSCRTTLASTEREKHKYMYGITRASLSVIPGHALPLHNPADIICTVFYSPRSYRSLWHLMLCRYRYSECLCQGKTASTNASGKKKKETPRENIYFLHHDTGKRSAFALSNRIGCTEFSIIEA